MADLFSPHAPKSRFAPRAYNAEGVEAYRLYHDAPNAFDRDWYNAYEIEQYALPIVEYRAKQTAEVPLSYVVDLEVKAGEAPVRIEYFYVASDAEVDHLLEWAAPIKILGYDLETSAIKEREGNIATMQFGNPYLQAGHEFPRCYTVDIRTLSPAALGKLLAVLESVDVMKLGQNIRFECRWTLHHTGAKLRNVWDTQIAEMLARAGLFPKSGGGRGAAYSHCSMAKLAQRHLGLDIDKDHDLRTSFFKTPPGTHSARQIVYAGGDTLYIFYIAKPQQELLSNRKLRKIAKIEMGLIPVLAEAEVRGMPIDADRWRQLWQESVKGRATAERELDEIMLSVQGDLFGGKEESIRPIYTGGTGANKKPVPINWGSPTQVKWAVEQYCKAIGWQHEVLRTPSQIKKAKLVWGQSWLQKQAEKGTGKGEDDIPDWVLPEERFCLLDVADKVTLVLRKCRGQLPPKLVDALIEYSKHSTREDDWGNNFLVKHYCEDTKAIHPEIHQLIAATGRLSMSPNLQAVPNDQRWRKCFRPRKGYKFVIGDYSTVEPRISAKMSRDENYMRAFLDDDDLYLAVAERMLGYRPDIHSKDPDVKAQAKLERAIFKTVVLALAYMMGPSKLRDRLTIALHKEIMSGKVPPPTLDYARELYDKFFEVHAAIREYQQTCVALAEPATSTRKIWDDFLQAEVTWVTAVCGRKRFFPPDVKSAHTEAPNVAPQGGSATITKVAAVRLAEEFDRRGWDAWVQHLVHDEIVVCCADEIAGEVAVLLKDVMEWSGTIYCGDVPIKAAYPEGTDGIVSFWAKELDEEEELAMAA